MKRFFATISAFVVILTIIYSGFWFYQSKKVKTLTEAYVREMTKRFGSDKSEFVYTTSKTSGFPFSFDVEFAKPKFVIDDRNLTAEISSEGSIIMSSNIIGSKLTVLLPKELNFIKAGEEKSALLVKFNEEPAILVKAKQKGLIPWIINTSVNEEDLPWVVTDFNYSDKGCNILRINGGAELASIKSASLNLKMGDDNSDSNYSLLMDFKSMQLDKLIELPTYADALGNLNIAADLSYKEEVDSGAIIEVKGLSMVSDGFSIDISGNIERSNSDALPFGVLRVKIGQYENFINYHAAFINYIVANSAFPLFNIKDKQIESTKEFLSTVASEKYNDDKDILILLNRKKNEDFRVGQIGFYEALQRFKLGVNGGDLGNKNATKIVVPNAM
jgi:hypothetical protein